MQFDLGQVFLILAGGSARLVGQLDRGERHVEQVELPAELLHDGPETIKVVFEQAFPERLVRQLQPLGAQVGDGRQLLGGDRVPRRPLDGLEHLVLARLDQGDRGALAAGPADAPDAVHVRLRRAGHVVVDHVGQLLDVEAARGHVGGHEQVDGPGAQPAHHPVALVLVHAAVQRLGAKAPAVQALGELVYLVPGPAEHDRGTRRLQVEHAPERGGLMPAGNDVGGLPHQQVFG